MLYQVKNLWLFVCDKVIFDLTIPSSISVDVRNLPNPVHIKQYTRASPIRAGPKAVAGPRAATPIVY